MLQTLRGTVGSWFIKILLGLIIISFSIWGIGDIFRNRGADVTIAQVEENTLGPDQLRTMVDRELQRLQQSYGGHLNINDNPDLRQALAQNSLQQWVTEKLYIAEAGKLGLAVSDDILKQHIAKDPAFFDPTTKQFSATAFRSLLQQNNLTEAQYIALVRRDLINAQLAWVLGGNIPVPTAMQKLQFQYDNEKRDAQVMEIPYSQFNRFAKLLGKERIGNPTDAELRALIDANQAEFSTPEYRDLTVVWLNPNKVATSIKISPDEIKAAYDADKTSYTKPERRNLIQAVFSDEAAAKKARALIDSDNISLAKAANAIAKLTVVPLDNVQKTDLPNSLQDGIFRLKADEISQPLKSELGWHVVQLVAVTPEKTKTLAEVEGELRQKLALAKANKDMIKLSDQLQDALAGGQDLKAIAASMPVTISSVNGITRAGEDNNGKMIALPLPKSTDTLLTVAFNTDSGKISPVTDAQEGGLFAVKVNAVTPPALRDFAAVKTKALRRFQEQDMAAHAGLITDKIKELVKGGKTMEQIADSYGLSTKTVTAIARDGKGAGPIGQALFAVPKGDVTNTVDGMNLLVGKITAIHSSTSKPDGLAVISSSLRREIASDISQQLRAAFTQRFDVTVNDSALENLF